jgi:metal-responsive CopG/Arc/MetJ family transcriptional regulator
MKKSTFKVQFSLSIPLELAMRIKEYCEKEDVAISKLVKDAVDKYLTEKGR